MGIKKILEQIKEEVSTGGIRRGYLQDLIFEIEIILEEYDELKGLDY